MVVTYIFVAIFIGMMGYLVYFTASNEENLINNNYNPRQQLLAEQNRRGSIFAGGGEVLAETVTDQEGKEARSYPYGRLFAHAVGYASKGKSGIESQMNYYLIQSSLPFSKKAADTADGGKSPGDSVYTSLDVNIQKTADEALGVYKGAIVVMRPDTGEILAMVSKPGYDPNEIDVLWQDIIEDENSTVLLNRVTQGMYPPGSTFKIITALEYIRENPDTYRQYQYHCTGKFTLGEDSISCYHGQQHGAVDFGKAFAKSCNTAFADMGLKLDKGQFSDTLEKLLFNNELPVSFAYNKSSIIINQDTDEFDMIQNAIGQGRTQMSPLHLAMLTGAVANRGELMTPYLVQRVEAQDGTVVKKWEPSVYGQLMSTEEARILKGLMTDVVEEGTATRLSGLTYTAAGKTGSAEYNKEKSESHAWFTGFAPADNPEIVVTIIMEGAGSGGDYAVPIAKRIFDAYFQQ